MSRNLAKTSCDNCGSLDIDLLEKSREITKEEAGPYFEEYEGLLVANAVCGTCEAKYLAWCDDCFRLRGHKRHDPYPGQKFFDLSYRSSFNDEPGDDDLTEVSRDYKDKRREYAETEADGLREQLRLALRARDNLSSQIDELRAAKKAAGKRAGAEIARLRRTQEQLLALASSHEEPK